MNGWTKPRESLHLLPDILKLKLIWWNWQNRLLDLENPRSLNEKLQWMKIYWRDERMRICADKYRVREYVTEKCGPEFLNELLGVYERAEDIDFDALPDSFVLKVNHTCGGNLLCRSKAELDREAARRFLNGYLHRDHYRKAREWCYKDIPRRIVAERYLEENGKPPVDYKFHCFNGEPLFIGLHLDRFDRQLVKFYDPAWNLLPFTVTPETDREVHLPPPACLDEMLALSRQLSADFPFVRVDLYCVNQQVWFGEMTFYPSAGRIAFSPASYDEYWGRRLYLPERRLAADCK